MTDQTTPDVTDEDRRIARDWAAHIIRAPFTSMPMESVAARVILHAVPAPPPPRPTLADMTYEERKECQWMQADSKPTGSRVVILEPNWTVGHARVLRETGRAIEASADALTPCPDLPRMEWPGDAPAPTAPALPDGWRLADHKAHGRIIVTSTAPDPNGHVYLVLPADDDDMGYDWHFCAPDELTYLDQEDYPPRNQLTLGAKWADITKLEEALRQKGEAADQAIVLDNDGDAYVWQAVGSGGWMIRIPAQKYGPFRLILNEQGADK